MTDSRRKTCIWVPSNAIGTKICGNVDANITLDWHHHFIRQGCYNEKDNVQKKMNWIHLHLHRFIRTQVYYGMAAIGIGANEQRGGKSGKIGKEECCTDPTLDLAELSVEDNRPIMWLKDVWRYRCRFPKARTRWRCLCWFEAEGKAHGSLIQMLKWRFINWLCLKNWVLRRFKRHCNCDVAGLWIVKSSGLTLKKSLDANREPRGGVCISASFCNIDLNQPHCVWWSFVVVTVVQCHCVSTQSRFSGSILLWLQHRENDFWPP